MDATIFDDGQGGGPGTIVSRGPGLLETRPARDKPVERTAYWEDKLETVDEVGPDKQVQKKITLTGNPKFVDTTQATNLEGRKPIEDHRLAEAQARRGARRDQRPTATATAASRPAAPSSGASRIESAAGAGRRPVDRARAEDHRPRSARHRVRVPIARRRAAPPRTAPAPTVPPSGAGPRPGRGGPRPPGDRPRSPGPREGQALRSRRRREGETGLGQDPHAPERRPRGGRRGQDGGGHRRRQGRDPGGPPPGRGRTSTRMPPPARPEGPTSPARRST